MKKENKLSSRKINHIVKNTTYPPDIEWRDTSQLRDENREGVYVNQGFAECTLNGSVLSSEGFSKCTAIILRNNSNSDIAYLAHLDQWNLHQRQEDMFDQLPLGEYSIIIVTGDISRVKADTLLNNQISSFENELFNHSKAVITKVSSISVKSEQKHWSLSFDPQSNTVKVFTRLSNKIHEYKL